jgi:hypothetical protein
MSRAITIYSCLTTRELQDVLARYEKTKAAFLEAHSAEDDDCGETSLGVIPPPASDDDQVQRRLEESRSALVIRDPGDTSLGLQASALAYLITQSAPCVVAFDPGEAQLGETYLGELGANERRLLEFKKPPKRRTTKTKARDAEPGELQIISILSALENLQTDRDRMLDARHALMRLDATAQAVLGVLIAQNVRSLGAVGAHCAKSEAEVETALTAIEETLAQV